MLETERLILRRWEESDAKNLFLYAKDPDVGPIVGWPPHQSVEESLDVVVAQRIILLPVSRDDWYSYAGDAGEVQG